MDEEKIRYENRYNTEMLLQDQTRWVLKDIILLSLNCGFIIFIFDTRKTTVFCVCFLDFHLNQWMLEVFP